MNPKDRDDMAHAIGQTLEFYGKELDKRQFSFWFNALADHPVERILWALKEYTKVGKYAPKPVDILDLIHTRRAQQQAQLPPPQSDSKPASPEITKAWVWFLRASSGLEFGPAEDVSPEQADEYLRIVNREARRFDNPAAIPDEYKLAEVWR